MKKPKMIMMMGLPGSGKSYEASIIAKELDAEIVASDDIREKHFAGTYSSAENVCVFQKVHKAIKRNLLQGKSVIFDATNLRSRNREHFLKNELRDIPCEKIGILMATPFSQCLRNNVARDKNVPEEAIRRMYQNFQSPYYYEGFDTIQIVLWQRADSLSPWDFPDEYRDYSQDNPYHALSLGAHSKRAFQYVLNEYLMKQKINQPECAVAALLHDCGKPLTQVFHDSKGNPTEEAHYYNHQNVGAYVSLFYSAQVPHIDSLLVSWLISKHMEPYEWEKNPQIRNKRICQYGADLVRMLDILHEADKFAH